jgi:hypothetical protein
MCGAAITCVEDSEDCTMESMFCSVCLGRGDRAEIDYAELKAKLVQSFEDRMDMANEEAVRKAQEIVNELEMLNEED